MFQKVHLRLAALCAGITIFILSVMSCCYLFISEQNLKTNSFASFLNDMNTLLENAVRQTVFTHDWISRIEDDGKYYIQIADHGVPFLFNLRSDKDREQLFSAVRDYYEETFLVRSTEEAYTSYHVEFPFSSDKNAGPDYYACVWLQEAERGGLQIIILQPTAPLMRQIRAQRVLFLGLGLLAAVSLSFFSWYFTKRLLKPLEESRKRQAQFVASASHELRTPLSVILSCVSAARQSFGGEQAHFLETAAEESRRMSHLIDDMLLLANTDAASWNIQKEPADMDTLLLDMFEAFEPLAKENSVHLSANLPKEAVPPCLCDRERIRQVLSILLNNALSYTPSGGHVRLSLAYDGKYTRLSVSDDGAGIPDPEKAHIFERFYRSDRSRSQKGHFGLGLSIAAEIIKNHRGQLLVSDTPGGGATFTVVL